MRRREFITLVGAAAAWPVGARAQQSKKVPRLCFLTFDPGTLESTRFKPFFQALRELGHVDGKTITIDYLSANGQGERFPNLAAECLQLKADIIDGRLQFWYLLAEDSRQLERISSRLGNRVRC